MAIIDKIDKLSGTDTRSRNITQAIDKYSGKGPSKNIDDAVKKLDETGTLGKMGIKERIDHLSNAQTMSRDITQAIDRHTGKGPSKNIEEALKNWEEPTPQDDKVVFDGDVDNSEESDSVYFTPLIQVDPNSNINIVITNMEWDHSQYAPLFEPEPQPIGLNDGRALIGKILMSEYGYPPVTFTIDLKENRSYIQIDGMGEPGISTFTFHLYIEKAE